MRPYGKVFGDGIEDLRNRMRDGTQLEHAIIEQEAEDPTMAAALNRDVVTFRKGQPALRQIGNIDLLKQLIGQPPEVEETPSVTGYDSGMDKELQVNQPTPLVGNFPGDGEWR